MTGQEKHTRLTLDEMIRRSEQVKEAKNKNKTKELKKRMKKLGISTDFMLTYLHRIGFNNLISLAELVSYFKGIFVPCVELYETMDFALNMFEIFDGIMKKRKQNIKMVCADASEQ